ncbi:DUF6461 domain-containing protein [Catenulispora subtropica]
MYGPTTELSAEVVDAIAEVVAAELEAVARLIPAPAAEALGRLGLAQLAERSFPSRYTNGGRVSEAWNGSVDALPPLVVAQLLGALKTPVAALDLSVPQLIEALPEAAARSGYVTIAYFGRPSEVSHELATLNGFVPGAADMVTHVVAALAGHPSIVPLLVADGSDEAAIVASHTTGYLALAVVTATVVLRPLSPRVTPPAIVGAALTAVAPVLRKTTMPAAYAEAKLARRRAEYLMPRHIHVSADVTDHVFVLAEAPLERGGLDFSGNGLVAVLSDGVAVRCRQESASVPVAVHVVEKPGQPDFSRWEEIVEVSWHAPVGGAGFAGGAHSGNGLLPPAQIAPPWPGDYRVRVSARGRDGGWESYELVVWRAPAADPVVHKRSDRLGHVLRGEPEPPVDLMPDLAYRWVETGSLVNGAAFTFVAGKSSREVLRDFGADESAPTPLDVFYDRLAEGTIDSWVCVLDVPGGSVAVEFAGWRGGDHQTLRALSSPDTKVASMYWNVNAHRRFSLARAGHVLDSFEPAYEGPTSSEAQELLADLDWRGLHRDAVGMVAASRYTGVSISAEDVARIEAVGIGYPVLPLLPELRPVDRRPDGSVT